MYPHRHLVLIAVMVLLTSWASALEGTKLVVAVDTPEIGDSPYGYLAYLPPGYNSDGGNSWPVWIFLEGLGEGGPGTVASMLAPANGIVRHGPMRELWRPAASVFDAPAPNDYPMIILTPQVGRPPAYRGITDIYKLDLFITAMLARYRIDPDRVVLSGMSTGGGDAVYYASYRVENVRRLAGLLPIVASHNYPTDSSGPGRASTLALTQSWFMTAFDDRGNGGTVTTAYAWSDAIAQALAAAVTPTPASLESTYPFGSGGVASANHQTATFGANNAWTWRAGATAGRRSSGAFKPDDTSRLMLGIYRSGGHPVWQDAVNNPDVLNWIISRQRQSPFTGTPHLLPGSIQAEQYDRGGPGRGFNELTSGNQGTSAYRQRTLPRWSRSGSDGPLQIANAPVDDPVEVSQSGATISIEVSAGEWVAYTSDVALSGSHDLVLRVASRAGAALRLTIDGTDITGPVTIPATGGPGTFRSITVPRVNLTGDRRCRTRQHRPLGLQS